MKINWKAIGGALLSTVATLVTAIDPTKLPGRAGVVVAIVGAVIAAASGKAVEKQ